MSCRVPCGVLISFAARFGRPRKDRCPIVLLDSPRTDRDQEVVWGSVRRSTFWRRLLLDRGVAALAQATGIDAPDDLPGVNLMDPVARSGRERVFGVTHSIHNLTVGNPDDTLQYLWCVEGDWKLILRYSGEDTTRYRNVHLWDKVPLRLYNLKNDPHETTDLALQHPERSDRLRRVIEAWYSVSKEH